jgi:nitrogen regulatory protein P-II 1
MKEIRAIVRPSRLPRLRQVLRDIPGFPGVTVFKAEGFTAPAQAEHRSIREELTDFTDKTMVTVLAPDETVDAIVQAISDTCRTGQLGDGLIWVVQVEYVHRIRDNTTLWMASHER